MRPSFKNMSLWQTPQAFTLIRTSPAPGLGISRSTTSNSPPGLTICAALIVAVATLVVAIIPPQKVQSYCRCAGIEGEWAIVGARRGDQACLVMGSFLR